MAYLYTAGLDVQDSGGADLFSAVVFVDLESGAYQANSVDLSGVKAWIQANLGATPASNLIQFVGYVPEQGSVWYYQGYLFKVAVNPKPSIPVSSAYSVLNAGSQQLFGVLLGVDSTGIYALQDANGGSFLRIGFDGSINLSSIGTPFCRESLGTPLLWRAGSEFRAFGQVGTAFSSSQRGATLPFNSPGNSGGLDSARSKTGVGTARGPEFSGYFNGYQPIPGADTTSIGSAPFRAENQSSTTCDLVATWFTDSSGLTRVYKQVAHLVDFGSGFQNTGTEVGAIYDMESLVAAQYGTSGRTYQFSGFGGVQATGLFGDAPPWEPDTPGVVPQFWTDVVQATENV